MSENIRLHIRPLPRVQETETEESRTANTITLKGHTAQYNTTRE